MTAVVNDSTDPRGLCWKVRDLFVQHLTIEELDHIAWYWDGRNILDLAIEAIAAHPDRERSEHRDLLT